jgi:hypothetical protein
MLRTPWRSVRTHEGSPAPPRPAPHAVARTAMDGGGGRFALPSRPDV